MSDQGQMSILTPEMGGGPSIIFHRRGSPGAPGQSSTPDAPLRRPHKFVHSPASSSSHTAVTSCLGDHHKLPADGNAFPLPVVIGRLTVTVTSSAGPGG